MTNLAEVVVGLVMLLTTAGMVATFVTFYRDEGRSHERSSDPGSE